MCFCYCIVRRAHGHSAHEHLHSITSRVRTVTNSRRHFVPPPNCLTWSLVLGTNGTITIIIILPIYGVDTILFCSTNLVPRNILFQNIMAITKSLIPKNSESTTCVEKSNTIFNFYILEHFFERRRDLNIQLFCICFILSS